MGYDNSNQIKAGLWSKVSQKGATYHSGSVVIGSQKYWVKLFKNDSENPKAPDYNVLLSPAEASVDYPNKPQNIDAPPSESQGTFQHTDDDAPDKVYPF